MLLLVLSCGTNLPPPLLRLQLYDLIELKVQGDGNCQVSLPYFIILSSVCYGVTGANVCLFIVLRMITMSLF